MREWLQQIDTEPPGDDPNKNQEVTTTETERRPMTRNAQTSTISRTSLTAIGLLAASLLAVAPANAAGGKSLASTAPPKMAESSEGSAMNQAPAPATRPATATNPVKLNRDKTFNVAQGILSRTGQAYTILPAGKNRLRGYPINFKTANGTLGGIMVYKNVRTSPSRAIAGIILAQAKTCRASLSVKPSTKKFKNGAELFTAKVICQSKTQRQIVIHEAVRQANNVLIVMARILPLQVKRRTTNAGRIIEA